MISSTEPKPASVVKSIARPKIDKSTIKKQALNATIVHLGQTVITDTNHSPTQQTSNKSNEKSTKKRAISNDSSRTLDGFLLMDLCKVEFPDQLVEAVLSEMHITEVVIEDLLLFTNLARLDMSDNKAPLNPFGCLPALIELDFQCNALENIVLNNKFQSLEVLNLSFNCLRCKDLEELSSLPQIRELYLGNNRIQSLPPLMHGFSRLETLSLESNNLSGKDTFTYLAIMPRLRNLNLSYNKISEFPEAALTIEEKRGAGFSNLVSLNLAHNKITDEEAVVHIGELRSLRELILYGNPLAHAAVTLYDPTRLSYDPVPTFTASLSNRKADQTSLTIMIAYPNSKKKKLHSMSCYGSMEMYKMISNDVVLQCPSRNRATELSVDASRTTTTDHELPKRQLISPTARRHRFYREESTFLTGVGIEDALISTESSTKLPAVPACMISRSLAANSKELPAMNTRLAVNALRYHLDHPLTSHDDSELFPNHSQVPTQACLRRQRLRHRLPKRLSLSTSPGSRGVDDALTQLNHEASPKRDKCCYIAEHGVDEALNSLISTAKKLNLTYNRSTHGSV